MRHIGLAMVTLCAALGCSGTAPEDASSTESSALGPPSRLEHRGRRHDLVVMTRNVYLGFDIAPILSAPTPADVPVRVAEAWSQMLTNDFVSRADALAREIDVSDPALIALEEVGLFRRTPHDGGHVQTIDYLAILERALGARGLAYDVAVVQRDSQVAAPMLAGFDASGAPLLDGVEMIDRDVVLARRDVKTSHPTAARYAASLPVAIGGQGVEIVRGWASVVARVDHGSAFRFVATHLEEEIAPPVQLAQAEELLGILAAEPLPVVLAGDFNSAADGSQTPTYGLVTSRGFADSWREAHPRAPGYTCCRPADLRQRAPLEHRIDFVFSREHGARRCDDDARAWLVGDEPRDRTSSGLWPSDHAGLVASVHLRSDD